MLGVTRCRRLEGWWRVKIGILSMRRESKAVTTETFGELHFGNAKLGDKRRTASLVRLVDAIVQHPGGSLPAKLRSPAMLDAMYRLCRRDEVSHEAVLAPHVAQTLETIDRRDDEAVLVLHDGTELDFTKKKTLAGQLGSIGNGSARGFLVHNSLAVTTDGAAIGLLGQILHCRPDVDARESAAEKREREDRESRLWCRGVAGLPANRKLVDVCDRGADTFEFLETETHGGRRFVIRSSYDRSIRPGHDADATAGKTTLHKYARTLEPLGCTTADVQKKEPKRKTKRKSGKLKHPPRSKRTAKLLLAAAPVLVQAPKRKRGCHGDAPLPMWVVRVWEPDPPQGEEPLEWFLLTNEPAGTLESAARVVGWYRLRWVIEEFHKGKKTGCGIEELQFQYRDRLEPAIALLSVTAVTLLQLRDAARAPDAKTRPATDFIGEAYVAVLSRWRHKEVRLDWSVYDFVLALARMGGHLNRKRDGLPGWITLWRGWSELCIRVDACSYESELEKCA